MTSLTETRAFWVLVAVVLYPVLFAGLLVLVLMPPLNLVAVPAWAMLILGAMGSISRGYEAAARRRVASRESRRYEPGVVPVQRTNAL